MRKIKNLLIITGIVIILFGMMGCSVMMAPAFSGCTKEEPVVEKKEEDTQEKPKEEQVIEEREEDTEQKEEQIEKKDEEVQAVTGDIGNLDELIEKASRDPNSEERRQLYLEIQNIVIENALTIPLYNPTGFHVEREWVRGWYPHQLRSGNDYYQLSKKEINTSNKVKNPNTLINLTVGEPYTLDPHWMYDKSSGEIVLNCYDNLIMYDGDSLTDFLPMISSEVPTRDDGLIRDGGTTYIFPIREGIKFHSGNELTPYDVEYSFERGILQDRTGGPQWMIIQALSGGEYSSLESWFEAYSGMSYSEAVNENREAVSKDAGDALEAFYNEVIDPLIEVDGNTVVIKLKRPFSPFLQIICHYSGWAAITDSEWMKENGAWDGNSSGWWKWHNIKVEDSPLYDQDAGSGPFKVQSWDRTKQKVILERYDDYWRGPTKTKIVIIWGIDRYSTRKAILEAGDADIVYVPEQYRDQVIDMYGVRVIEGYPTAEIATFFMNQQVDKDSEYLGSGKLDGKGIPRDFFSDIHVRKAFRHCYNSSVFTNEVLYGLGSPISTNLPVGWLGYSNDLPLPEFSLRKATEEFKKAFDGKLWEKGFEITFFYSNGKDINETVCEMLKYYIEQINHKFTVNVVVKQQTEFIEAYSNGLLPAYCLTKQADFMDPHNFFFNYYHSDGFLGKTYYPKTD